MFCHFWGAREKYRVAQESKYGWRCLFVFKISFCQIGADNQYTFNLRVLHCSNPQEEQQRGVSWTCCLGHHIGFYRQIRTVPKRRQG